MEVTAAFVSSMVTGANAELYVATNDPGSMVTEEFVIGAGAEDGNCEG